VILDEVIASLASVAAILVVGGVILLLVVSRQRRADPRWRRISTITQDFVLAVLVLAVVAVLFAVSSDDPRLRF
jgi:glucan phosphoethanolaminetransferase (alkaline phosphatase superfamily)